MDDSKWLPSHNEAIMKCYRLHMCNMQMTDKNMCMALFTQTQQEVRHFELKMAILSFPCFRKLLLGIFSTQSN